MSARASAGLAGTAAGGGTGSGAVAQPATATQSVTITERNDKTGEGSMKSARIIAGLTLALTAFGAHSAAAPEKWPARPVRMVVPFSPGAASDVLSRTVGQRFSEIYGQQFVADNRAGAGGLIGSQLIRAAAADGYTLGMVGQPHLSNVLLRDDKPYDPLNDFTPISLVGITPNVIVIGKGIEAKTIPDLIALAKAKPGALNYGSAGPGSSSHLAGALFASRSEEHTS